MRLRSAEQRYTSGRRRLVELLAEAPRPETIPELLGRAPSLAQSSAYRNLVVLEEAGVAHRVVTSDERSRYELAEDLMGHHHHLICTSCGKVDDFTVSTQMERSLEGRPAAGRGRHRVLARRPPPRRARHLRVLHLTAAHAGPSAQPVADRRPHRRGPAARFLVQLVDARGEALDEVPERGRRSPARGRRAGSPSPPSR